MCVCSYVLYVCIYHVCVYCILLSQRHISGTSINISSDNEHGLESDSFNSSVTSTTSQLSDGCSMLVSN